MADDPRVVIDFTRDMIVGQSDVIETIQQTVEEQSIVKDNTRQIVEEPIVVTDIIKGTVEQPGAVRDIIHETSNEDGAVINITQQIVEKPSTDTDITQQAIEKQSVVANLIQEAAEETRAVLDINKINVEDEIQQNEEELSSVTHLIQQSVEKLKAVTHFIQEINREPNAISDVIKQTMEELSAVTDDTFQKIDKLSAVTDISRQAIAILRAANDFNQEMDEELVALRDVTQQTIKVPSAERDTTQRKFGYVKVSWEIENFFLETKNVEWEISSPDFNVEGFPVTKWQLILRVKQSKEGNNQDSYICLKRLDGENDKSIRVCWNVWYKFAGEKLTLCDRENLIKSNDLIAVPIKNFELFKRSIRISLSSTICIEGLILTRNTGNEVILKRSEDLGVRRLSEEISIAYGISQHQYDIIKYDSFSDIKMNTEGYALICHKPVLCARCKTLGEVIDKNIGRSEIDLNFSSGKAGRKIFQYLYSGNLSHILRVPSISIDKAIDYLGMEDLKSYYSKDSIHLLTRFNAEEIFFKWIVTDINSNENFLFSPIFSREKLGLAFRLRLGLNKDCPEITYLSLKLDVIERNNIPEFHVISGIANDFGRIFNRRDMQWSSEKEADTFNFTTKCVLSDSSITGNGCLTIVCFIFIPDGTKFQSVVKTQKCLLAEVDTEKHYRLLSAQLSSLFETGEHADLYIACQKEIFKVHKCVLFVRSPIFRRAIREMRNLEGKKIIGFSMNDFDPKILRIILSYIYSGVLNCEKDDILDVYEGSKKLSIITLQHQSYNLLLNNLDVSNAIEILFRAVEMADFRLVDPICYFMRCNLNEIRLQKNWEKFIMNKEAMYEKLKDYAKDHSMVHENA